MSNRFDRWTPGTVEAVDRATRIVRVSFPGVTREQGAEEFPEAQVCYATGEQASDTEVRIPLGALVWLDFIGGDPSSPIVLGFRTPEAGNVQGWRRVRQQNIELQADTEMLLEATAGDITLTAGGTVNVQGASLFSGPVQAAEAVTMAGGASVAGAMTLNGTAVATVDMLDGAGGLAGGVAAAAAAADAAQATASAASTAASAAQASSSAAQSSATAAQATATEAAAAASNAAALAAAATSAVAGAVAGAAVASGAAATAQALAESLADAQYLLLSSDPALPNALVLAPGVNIALDSTTTPGTVTISSTATGGGSDGAAMAAAVAAQVTADLALAGAVAAQANADALEAPVYVLAEAHASLPNARVLVAGTNTTVGLPAAGQVAVSAPEVAGSRKYSVLMSWSGAGSDIASADADVVVRPLPVAGTITQCMLYARPSGSAAGSCVLTLKKTDHASYVSTVGTGTSIVASAPPSLSSAEKATNPLTGWSTSVAAGDILIGEISSVSGLRNITLYLEITP